MTLKTVYETRDEIPEGLREHFVERDGKFRFNADDYETKQEISALRSALQKERENVRELKDQQKTLPEDFDAAKWDAVKHLDPEKIGSDEQSKAQIESLQNQVERLKTQVQTEKKTREDLENTYKTTTVRGSVKDSLLRAGITDEIYLDAAMERLMRKHRVQAQNDEGEFKVTAGDLDQPLEDYVREWSRSDEGRRFVTPKKNSGGGDPPKGSGSGDPGEKNPFSKDHFNLTEQAKLLRVDRAKAEKLAAEAGVKL